MSSHFLMNLQRGASLSITDLDALDSLCKSRRQIGAKKYVLRQGDMSASVPVLLSGWAARCQILRNGSRQITNVLLPGDCCYFSAPRNRSASEEIVTLCQSEVAFIDSQALECLMMLSPPVADAIHHYGQDQNSLLSSWIVNVGRRDALERMAHFICETYHRLLAIGEVSGDSFYFPLTQEDLADVLSLTPVHTNRKLQQLRQEGLISLRSKELRIRDRFALESLADFQSDYLSAPAKPQRAQILTAREANPNYIQSAASP